MCETMPNFKVYINIYIKDMIHNDFQQMPSVDWRTSRYKYKSMVL